MINLDPRDEWLEQRGEPVEELVEVGLDPSRPERKIKIGSGLDKAIFEELLHVLRSHADIFAWSPQDMLGIDPGVMVH